MRNRAVAAAVLAATTLPAGAAPVDDRVQETLDMLSRRPVPHTLAGGLLGGALAAHPAGLVVGGAIGFLAGGGLGDLPGGNAAMDDGATEATPGPATDADATPAPAMTDDTGGRGARDAPSKGMDSSGPTESGRGMQGDSGRAGATPTRTAREPAAQEGGDGREPGKAQSAAAPAQAAQAARPARPRGPRPLPARVTVRSFDPATDCYDGGRGEPRPPFSGGTGGDTLPRGYRVRLDPRCFYYAE